MYSSNQLCIIHIVKIKVESACKISSFYPMNNINLIFDTLLTSLCSTKLIVVPTNCN